MAKIIPFPVPARPLPSEHSDRSLTLLRAALAEQSAEVAAWRKQLERLRVGIGALGRALDDQNARLGLAKLGVAKLHAQAERLEAWADTVLGR